MAEIIDFVVDVLENGMRMQVSAKKSRVIASKPSIAQAIVEATHGSKVSGDTHAKLSGTGTVGGNRRTTKTFRNRLGKFSSTLPRYKALKEIGGNAALMARTVGVPAIMYGCETIGFSDSS